MTQQQIKDIDLTLALMLQLQSVLHTIDELSHSVVYKREFKQRTENFYKFISKHVEKTTSELPYEQVDKWQDITNEFDKLVKQIRLAE